MSNLEIDKNINKNYMLNTASAAPSGAVDATAEPESGFERIFDAVKKRLSGQSDAATGGNDLPAGALCIVPISPAINVLTPGAAEISEDVIRTYARQQGLNPAVLGALLGHALPNGVAGEMLAAVAPNSLLAPAALPGSPAAAAGQGQTVLTDLTGRAGGAPNDKLPATAFDAGELAGLIGANSVLAGSRAAPDGGGARLESALQSGAGVSGETAAAGGLRSIFSAAVQSPVLSQDKLAANGPALAAGLAAETAGMRSPAAAAKWQGMAESADASGAVSRFAIEQTLQQTVQIRQAALPVASIVAGQLAQSLKFERAAALHAQAPAAEMKDSEEATASGAAGPQALVGVVVLEELDLTHLTSARGVQTGADTAPAVSSPGNAAEAKASEGVWRQERVLQDLQYQKLSEQMMEAVGRRITDQVAKGVWQMSFQLRPVRLGKVDVSLGMANGTIDAAFSSAQAETRQLLDSGLTRLKEVLQGAGFEVGNLQTGGRSAGEQSGRRSQSGSREMGMLPAGGMAPATRGVELNAAGPRTLLSADGVDLIV